MMNVKDQIEASKVAVENDVVIGRNSMIRGKEIILGKGVRIGDHVEITCDKLELRDGCAIRSNSTILCPHIVFENGCFTGDSLQVELNEYFYLGRHSHIGSRVSIAGQGLRSGEFLWMKDEVVVGGGGSKGPHAYLTIGNRAAIYNKCFINLSEEVNIGSNSGLSYNVVLLTHGAWQPVLAGYLTKFAPVNIGNDVVVYLNSVVLPGVTIGDHSTVGAGSVVRNNIPSYCLATGNPAKIRKRSGQYPPPLNKNRTNSLIGKILADYLTTLTSKGVRVIHNFPADKNYVTVEFENHQETICYVPMGGAPHLNPDADIVLSVDLASEKFAGKCHFDLAKQVVTGELTRIAEDLRDYLRRRAIRIFTNKPFQSLPLANLERLKTQILEKNSDGLYPR